jgi:hypothetical protein
MNDEEEVLFGCPFSRPGEDDLAINAKRVVEYAMSDAEGNSVMLPKHPDLGLLSHSHSPCAETPCPHLVNLWIGIHLYKVLDEGPTSHGELFLMWEHPWLTANDQQRAVMGILWDDDEFGGAYPRRLHDTADSFRTISVETEDPRAEWVLDVQILVKVALDPVAFLEEVRQAISQMPV